MKKVTVIGAGVIGLTTAIRLREAGFDARVFARETGQNTTSAVAAAVWEPFAANPPDKIEKWCGRTYEILSKQAEDPASGVDAVDCRQLQRSANPSLPFWHKVVAHASFQKFDDVSSGGITGEFRYRSYRADMSIYLDYLQKNYKALGGSITIADFTALDQAFSHTGIVVNCAGLGSGLLANDPEIYPARGVVLLSRPKVAPDFILDADNPEGLAYIVPRRDCQVLGGTYEPHKTDMIATEQEVAAIFRRCCKLFPSLAQTRIETVKVGLRPSRSGIRLALEKYQDGGLLIHNYGHGGSGVTVSWGCAEEVVTLLHEAGA